MKLESLMQQCEELGIKLALKGDDNDRLQVDAPKGALSAPLREALSANKANIITALKLKAANQQSKVNAESDSAATIPHIPARTSSNLAEASPLISEQHPTNSSSRSNQAEVEVDRLLSGSDYDINVIASKDPATRQTVAARLLESLANQAQRTADPSAAGFSAVRIF